MIAMHVAAANPQALDAAGLDPAVVEREKDVLADKFKAAGKTCQCDRQDRRVRPQDLLQGSLPARAGLTFTSRTRASRRRSRKPKAKWAGRSRLPASCVTGSARALRSRKPISPPRSRPPPGRADRRGSYEDRAAMSDPAYRRVIVKLSGEALAGAAWLRHRSGDGRDDSPPIWSPPRNSASNSASWSAAAISSAASKSPRAACRARSATPWACWRR